MSHETSRTYPAGVIFAGLEGSEEEAGARRSLLVYHREGTEAVPLEPQRPVTVGRSAPADLKVPDRSLSRVHARFTVDVDGRVTVEDVGSTNGTWLRGKRVQTASLDAGDEVVLGGGGVVAYVHATLATPAEARGAAPTTDGLVVASDVMRDFLAMAERVAASAVPVLVLGETGTGKEVVARFLHEKGPRRAKRLVAVNCGAIPPQLVESTLFGHEKGAFTGAALTKKGVFEEADGGTLLLDEVAELPAPAQAALLRVLETKRLTRVGGVRDIAVDVRTVAATHRDLSAMIEAGTFREDLYYRLSTMVLTVPPLRERAEEIEPLAHHFVVRAAEGRPIALSHEALARLHDYAWPGNVRELRNAIERAVLVARGPRIEVGDLPERVRVAAVQPRMTMPPIEPQDAEPDEGPGDLRARLAAYEARALVEALEATGWNRTDAAKRLGMPVRTLSHKMTVLGVRRPGKE